MQNAQQDDIQILKDLNMKIGAAEDAGNREQLSKIVAPTLSFLRADWKTFEDRESFLRKVTRPDTPEYRETHIEAIEFFGNRAVVRCIVTLTSKDGVKRYDNLRLFVRQDKDWKLLGWANEPHPEASDRPDQSV